MKNLKIEEETEAREISCENVKGHAPVSGDGESNLEATPNNPSESEPVTGDGLCAPSCSLFRSLWFSCRYKNATVHIGEDISGLNRMMKRGWRVKDIMSQRVYGTNGSFHDYFQAEIINKSIFGLFAPKNSHKVIGETPIVIGGGAVDSNRNQLPAVVNTGSQIPFVGNDNTVKFDKLSEVNIGGCIHNKEILSANVKGQERGEGGGDDSRNERNQETHEPGTSSAFPAPPCSALDRLLANSGGHPLDQEYIFSILGDTIEVLHRTSKDGLTHKFEGFGIPLESIKVLLESNNPILFSENCAHQFPSTEIPKALERWGRANEIFQTVRLLESNQHTD